LTGRQEVFTQPGSSSRSKVEVKTQEEEFEQIPTTDRSLVDEKDE
jgi:hypothetical protein